MVRLPPSVSEKDLWKIEAGLQLSKDKIAEYHPVNELLKIKQGLDAGLTDKEIAAAMYGRTVDEINDAISRLELIDAFLVFINQPENYSFIKIYGLHEYFIDAQKYLVDTAKRKSLSKKEITDQLNYAFALLKANVLVKKDKEGNKGITHWDFRKLAKIYSNPFSADSFVQPFVEAKKNGKKITTVSSEIVLESFHTAVDIVKMKEQKDQPVKLIETSINSLESIDRKSKHFREDAVKEAMHRLIKIVNEIRKELGIEVRRSGHG